MESSRAALLKTKQDLLVSIQEMEKQNRQKEALLVEKQALLTLRQEEKEKLEINLTAAQKSLEDKRLERERLRVLEKEMIEAQEREKEQHRRQQEQQIETNQRLLTERNTLQAVSRLPLYA